MTTTRAREPLNGVNVAGLLPRSTPSRTSRPIAAFQFRARNEWISGTHNRSTIQGFYGAGQEDVSRTEPFVFGTGHPAVLVGDNGGPTAAQFLLRAIAACLTSGVGNIAAARGVTLYRVASTVEGGIDLLGLLGLSDDVRNGFRQLRVSFDIDGDGRPEQLAELVLQSRRRSAVHDVLVNGTDVVIDVNGSAVA